VTGSAVSVMNAVIFNAAFSSNTIASIYWTSVLTILDPLCGRQSSWLQSQRSGFDSRCYQIFWEVVNLERGPLSLVSTTEELLERKTSGSGLENRDYGGKGSVTQTTHHPCIRKSWHKLRQQAAVAGLV
jgi:hypothetical protein